jgi:hypothetical protein
MQKKYVSGKNKILGASYQLILVNRYQWETKIFADLYSSQSGSSKCKKRHAKRLFTRGKELIFGMNGALIIQKKHRPSVYPQIPFRDLRLNNQSHFKLFVVRTRRSKFSLASTLNNCKLHPIEQNW